MRKSILYVCCALFVVTAGAAMAESAQHELRLNIPETGKVRISVDRTISKSSDGRSGVIALSYDIVNSYACKNDACTVSAQTVNAALKSFNGQVPPKAVDTRPVIGSLLLIDGVSYSADTDFRPLHISDMARLKANYADMMMSGIEESRRTPEMKANMANAIEHTVTALGGESAAPAFAPEAALLAWPHNASLELGVPASQMVNFVSPIDGSPLPATLTMTLDAWDEAKGTATIRFDNAPDAAALAAYIQKVGPQILASVGAPAQGADAMKDVAVKLSTHCLYDMDLKTGLVRKADCTVEKGFTIVGQGGMTTDHFLLTEALVQ
jgi:hypothetical protein